MTKYVMALDQGTTNTRCVIFNEKGIIVSRSQKELRQIYPKSGWVEHDPMEIWSSQISLAVEAMAKINARAEDIAAIGIANQRETTIVWDKETGKPVYNAIVWQCTRTAKMCEELKVKGFDRSVKEKTGLILDPYFSGTKVKWILDNVEGARVQAEKGNLLFGTIDTWLIWKLTRGRVHVTDYTNASRTMLYNIHELKWDEEILSTLDIPKGMLPEVKPSSYIYGYTDNSIFGSPIAIAGAIGDQQAALFGQTCFEKETTKNTYGTGCAMLMNTGSTPIESKNGLLTTIAWAVDGKIEYALEGSVYEAGSAVQWLRDDLRMIKNIEDCEGYATSVEDTNGVYLVPALVGWDPYARGTVVGLTRGSNKEHFIRATLESIAYQTYDLLKAMQLDSGATIKVLKVDGGVSANNFLMQFQADILGVSLVRPEVIETTALGTAYLAGLAVGYFKNRDELVKNFTISRSFTPSMQEDKRLELLKGWHKALNKTTV